MPEPLPLLWMGLGADFSPDPVKFGAPIKRRPRVSRHARHSSLKLRLSASRLLTKWPFQGPQTYRWSIDRSCTDSGTIS